MWVFRFSHDKDAWNRGFFVEKLFNFTPSIKPKCKKCLQ